MTAAAISRELAATALAAIESLSARRRCQLLAAHAEPEAAWAALCGRTASPLIGSWEAQRSGIRVRLRERATQLDLDRCASLLRSSSSRVLVIGDDAYPPQLATDFDPPAVVFAVGELGLLGARRAGVIGTRNATEQGRRLAFTLGAELSRAGVAVVSGLARGIDGSAHKGVLIGGRSRETLDGVAPADASWVGPIAVVGSGPDVAFPRSNRDLWRHVCVDGLLLSEYPPGSEPLAHHFPARNRILAALSEVLVVVESRDVGGSLLTVSEAIRRQVDVLAVPGSPLSRAAGGTNRIIADGARPVLEPSDVLMALGLETRRQGTLPFDPRPAVSTGDRRVLELIGHDILTLDELVVRSGDDIRSTAMAVGRLDAMGWLHHDNGWISVLPLPAPSRCCRPDPVPSAGPTTEVAS